MRIVLTIIGVLALSPGGVQAESSGSHTRAQASRGAGISSAKTPSSAASDKNGATKEWVLYAMTWASRLSGYPLPDSLPEVRFESQDWFSHRACRDHRPCPVFGLYDDHGVVFLREDLTDPARDHIAVHEFVHYLQQQSGQFDSSSCFDTDKREQEAFRVQRRYIAEVQGGFSMFGIQHLPCRPQP
jgi:hypothetical protein